MTCLTMTLTFEKDSESKATESTWTVNRAKPLQWFVLVEIQLEPVTSLVVDKLEYKYKHE